MATTKVFVVTFENEDGCSRPFSFVRTTLESAKAAVERHASELLVPGATFELLGLAWTVELAMAPADPQEMATHVFSDPHAALIWTVYPSYLVS